MHGHPSTLEGVADGKNDDGENKGEERNKEANVVEKWDVPAILGNIR